MAAEQPKKITGGAFGQYLTENRAALLKELPGQPATAAVKLASQRFKSLDDDARAKYQQMYEAALQKYEKDLAAFLSAGGELKSKKSKKSTKVEKSKDPNKPKRPAGGAFGCFLAKNRAGFMKDLGPGTGAGGIAKLAGERWKQISEAEKLPYQKEFEEKQAQYKNAMETYVPPAVEEEVEGDAHDEEEKDAEDEGEEEEEEEEDAPKKRKATSNDDAPAAKKGKKDKVEAVPEKRKATSNAKAPSAKNGETAGLSKIDAEAKKLGFSAKLKALSENPKVKFSPSKILAELQKQNGSVVAAKRALLGA